MFTMAHLISLLAWVLALHNRYFILSQNNFPFLLIIQTILEISENSKQNRIFIISMKNDMRETFLSHSKSLSFLTSPLPHQLISMECETMTIILGHTFKQHWAIGVHPAQTKETMELLQKGFRMNVNWDNRSHNGVLHPHRLKISMELPLTGLANDMMEGLTAPHSSFRIEIPFAFA